MPKRRETVVQVEQLLVERSMTFRLHIETLTLPTASITCIAGPNGSGKSTLLNCLVGLLRPDHGTVHIQGRAVDHDIRATKATIGYIPDDEEWCIAELSAREYIDLLTEVYAEAGVTSDTTKRALELAAALYFTAMDQPIAQLSHGNKKKVQLVAGLMHQPAVIIIDELRNGLDPLAITAAEQIIQTEAKRGACIVAATHDLWWAERLAQRVLLLKDGAIAAADTVPRIVARHGSVEQLFMRMVQP